MLFSVLLELCHLVFGSNSVILCPVQIVPFSVLFELRHLVSGSDCFI